MSSSASSSLLVLLRDDHDDPADAEVVPRPVSPDSLELSADSISSSSFTSRTPLTRSVASFDERVAGGFKIRTCSGHACARRRDQLNLNIHQAFSALAQERAPCVDIEECNSCILSSDGGASCEDKAPCVAIRHEHSSTVRGFGNIHTEADVERVWSCVETALRAMEAKQQDVKT